MSSHLSKQIAHELPYLRRYARAMAGDQSLGDEAVKIVLQALLDGRAPLDAKQVRLSLYRAFYTNWLAGFGAPVAGTLANDRIVASRVGSVQQLCRHALILSALEGMRVAQIAEIMGKSELEVAKLIGQAHDEMHRQPPTAILIIEDEPIIALDIATAVERQGHSVIGIAMTHKDAIELARARPPGLILADIQLADDSSGIEAVREILEAHATPVIFITAFPERLLTGERPEPAFLLTKPFDPETLNVAIAQALVGRQSLAA